VTIAFEQALALCRSDPEAAARLICELSAKVDTQQRQIELLLRKVADLERKVAQLSKNSTNSSKPPSSDITRPKAQQRQQGKRGTCLRVRTGRSAHNPAMNATNGRPSRKRTSKSSMTIGSTPARSAACLRRGRRGRQATPRSRS
jgi:hypothetical protein